MNKSNKIITVPNIITSARILLSCYITGYLMKYGINNPIIAGTLFGTVALTDGVDGYIARKFHQESEVGKWLDPVADKILNWGVGGILIFQGIVPLWSLSIVARDLYVGTKTLIHKRRLEKSSLENKNNLNFDLEQQKKILSPTMWGKTKMGLQAASICSSIFFGWGPISTALMAGAIGVAAVDTVVVTKNFFKAKKQLIEIEKGTIILNNEEDSNSKEKMKEIEENQEMKMATKITNEKIDTIEFLQQYKNQLVSPKIEEKSIDMDRITDNKIKQKK